MVSVPVVAGPSYGLDRMVRGLAYAFVFVLPWANLIVVPVLGTGTRVVGILLTGCWLASVLVKDQLRPLSGLHHVAYALAAWLAVTVFWSPDQQHSTDAFIQYVQLFLLTVIIWNVFSNYHDLVWLKQAYVLGCWTTFSILAYNFLVGEVTEWESRATLANSNANEVGFVLGLGLPIAWYLATNADPMVREQLGRLRLANYLYIGAGILGITLTASRGSFISILPFVGYLVVSLRGQSPQRRLFMGFSLGALLVSAFFLVPESAWERISTIPQSVGDRDLGARYQIWSELVGAIFATVPSFLFGNGVSAADILVKDAHNIVISVFVGTGVVGLILFGSLFVGVVHSAFGLAASEKAMWLAVLAIFFIGSMAYSSDAHKVTWLIIAMVLAQRGAMRETAASEHSANGVSTAPSRTEILV